MVVYECEYMVDSRDIDPWYHCRASIQKLLYRSSISSRET